jgi:1,4-alpha-glucan branching enzyme
MAIPVTRISSAVLGLIAACATAPAATPSIARGEVRFVHHAPGAKTVGVIGSFNGWEPAAMQRSADGSFQVWLPVPPGEYRFAFRVTQSDGKVTTDAPEQASAFDDDGFGSKNGVLYVPFDDNGRGNSSGGKSSLKSP